MHNPHKGKPDRSMHPLGGLFRKLDPLQDSIFGVQKRDPDEEERLAVHQEVALQLSYRAPFSPQLLTSALEAVVSRKTHPRWDVQGWLQQHVLKLTVSYRQRSGSPGVSGYEREIVCWFMPEGRVNPLKIVATSVLERFQLPSTVRESFFRTGSREETFLILPVPSSTKESP